MSFCVTASARREKVAAASLSSAVVSGAAGTLPPVFIVSTSLVAVASRGRNSAAFAASEGVREAASTSGLRFIPASSAAASLYISPGRGESANCFARPRQPSEQDAAAAAVSLSTPSALRPANTVSRGKGRMTSGRHRDLTVSSRRD